MRLINRMAVFALFGALLFGIACPTAAETVLQFAYRSGGEPRTIVAEAWIAEFERTHPNVRVEQVSIGAGIEKVLVMMIAGLGPDVTEAYGERAEQWARQGLLLDLRPYVKRDFSPQDIADFWPPAWNASFTKFGQYPNGQFRLPRYMQTAVFYYNEDLCRGSGLATPIELDARGTWNWDSLKSSAKKMTYRTDDRVQTHGLVMNTVSWSRMVQWARGTGGDFFDPEDPTRFIGDMPEAVEGMSFLQNMIWEDGCMAPNWIPASFYTGDVGIVKDGIHAIIDRFDFRIQQAFKWNIAPSPMTPTGKRNARTTNDGFSIWAQTRHPQEAWAFMKFLTSQKGQELMVKHEGLAPVRRSAMRSYSAIRPDLNLFALALNVEHVAPLPVSNSTLGDTGRIDEVMTEMLTASLAKNLKPFEQAAREAKPILEALAREIIQ
jgi:multiple sugar transport system substrate-binding protein